MKTKQVPIIITLIAGFVTCIIGIIMKMEMARFVKTWVIVLVSFYILGCIVKLVLDKNFREETEEATDEAVEGEESESEGDETEELSVDSTGEEENSMGDS